MTATVSKPARALLAGATCILILGGMIVGHAWPLWTGRTVTMNVVPVDPRDIFRGEYVRLSTPANQLYREGTVAPSAGWTTVRALDRVFDEQRQGQVVYAQLAPMPSGDYVPVSASLRPVEGAINLRGRVRRGSGGPQSLTVDYGLDAFYMQEGRARRVEDATRERKDVKMVVAIASSGQARIRTLLVDGVPVDRF